MNDMHEHCTKYLLYEAWNVICTLVDRPADLTRPLPLILETKQGQKIVTQ